jgi:hypothetical protein
MSFFPQSVDPIFMGAQRMQPGIGADEEMVQRAALAQIKNEIAGVIAYEEALWHARDLAFFSEMGWEYVPVKIEVPELRSFYLGARPSLVEAPVKFWPSITVRANSATPSMEQLDQIDEYNVPLIIEVLCKAGPVKQTELHDAPGIKADGMVDAQSQRLSAAVIGCIAMDKTLGGVVASIQKPPTVKPSVPFSRPGTGKGGTGDYFVFQGKQIQYTVTKYSY